MSIFAFLAQCAVAGYSDPHCGWVHFEVSFNRLVEARGGVQGLSPITISEVIAENGPSVLPYWIGPAQAPPNGDFRSMSARKQQAL